ncbi:MAG: response regulator transcription factor [Cytophagales bacterium]|nr:response regulator transcription factor [Cytophagales bacterium]
MILNCVTIDDEPLARECVANYAREVDFLNLVGAGNNPLDLTRLLHEQPVDLVFLDIQMPKINGIEYLKMTPNPPLVILTTAYPNYALDGFQLNVLDYLLKPFTFNRFFKAANKAREYHQLLRKPESRDAALPAPAADYFFIKCDSKYERIFFADILYVQALQNYVTLCTTRGKYVTLLPLKSVEGYLDGQSFIRVHKSFIVAIPKIEAIENDELVIGAFRIPVSRNYREEVIDRVVNKRLWKK